MGLWPPAKLAARRQLTLLQPTRPTAVLGSLLIRRQHTLCTHASWGTTWSWGTARSTKPKYLAATRRQLTLCTPSSAWPSFGRFTLLLLLSGGQLTLFVTLTVPFSLLSGGSSRSAATRYGLLLLQGGSSRSVMSLGELAHLGGHPDRSRPRCYKAAAHALATAFWRERSLHPNLSLLQGGSTRLDGDDLYAFVSLLLGGSTRSATCRVRTSALQLPRSRFGTRCYQAAAHAPSPSHRSLLQGGSPRSATSSLSLLIVPPLAAIRRQPTLCNARVRSPVPYASRYSLLQGGSSRSVPAGRLAATRRQPTLCNHARLLSAKAVHESSLLQGGSPLSATAARYLRSDPRCYQAAAHALQPPASGRPFACP